MEILRYFVLLSLIVDIALAVYEHNFNAAYGYFIALLWFGSYWYAEKKKRPVINIFIEKEDGSKESEDDAQGSQAD